MGHERIGFLPRTKPWARIVDQLSSYDGDIDAVKKIAESTLKAIRKTYEAMPFDESVIKAITFLTILSFSAKQEHQTDYLNASGFSVDSNISIYSLMASAQTFISTDKDSLEVNKIAKDAALQAIIDYQNIHNSGQISLFGEVPSVWESVGTGAAFCELARSFFAAFTDKQIKYYLDREAASSIGDYSKLQSFSKQLSEHTQEISNHAFDISKIMQSFAAGWFNKHAATSLPNEETTIGLLTIAFNKLREEFRREGEDK